MSTWHDLDEDSKRLFLEASFEGATLGELIRNLPGRVPDLHRAAAAIERLSQLGLIAISRRSPSGGWVRLDAHEALPVIRSSDNWLERDGRREQFTVEVTQSGEGMMREVNVRLAQGETRGLVTWDGLPGSSALTHMRLD